MKFFTVKRAMNFCGFDLYNFFATTPLWAIRPLINFYYGDCWAEIPENPPVLFIHIPKNAGSSVMEALYGKAFGHRPASFYMANDARKFKRRMTFAIVRNPYDRFCSIFYNYLSLPGLSPWQKNVGKSFFSLYSSPDELANKIRTNQRTKAFYMSLIHSLPQRDWLMVEGKIVVQYLFPFEKMDKVETFLRDVLQDPVFSLPHVNASKRSNTWQNEIGLEAKQLIEKLYKDDIRLWESLI